ncbi:hypothetical protein ISCGN_001316 [Ixodes scapularis]
MGTALRNLVQKHKQDDGGRISGKGRLTGDLISKLTSYYGWALKSHAGNVDRMHSAVMATYYHITSTDEKKNHSLCPSGVDSWCKHNAATAKDEPPPKHRYKLPDNVSNALLPVYQRLADKRLLRRCRRGKTQNANEALHSVIWSLTPKHKHASLFAVETAVADAIMRFNVGKQQATSSILQELQLDQSCKGGQRAAEEGLSPQCEGSKEACSLGSFPSGSKKKATRQASRRLLPGSILSCLHVKKMIRDDPRYSKFSSSERKCEKEFKEYLKDKMAAAKSDFRELLKETKTITYRSKKQMEESEQHLLDIQKVLEKDKRYLVLGCIPDERRKLLTAYMEDLDRRGPPPPPTASEPTRRTNK